MNLALSLVASVVILLGDDSPDTISFMRDKADVIVVATVGKQIMSMGSAPIADVFYPRPYYFDARISSTLKGIPFTSRTIPVFARRIEKGSQAMSINEGDEVILFLKKPTDNEPGRWQAVDAWFGITPYSAGLEAALSGKLDFKIQ